MGKLALFCLQLKKNFIKKRYSVMQFFGLIFSLFACWFQPAQISQPTVFFSYNKAAPASPNQPRNRLANRKNENRNRKISISSWKVKK